jgi:pyridoxine 5-phosphate synthase
MSARPRLSFAVDGVAALRQSRRADAPDPVEAALVAEQAGADQICAHLWQDRRHVQDRDVQILRRVVKTELALYLAPGDSQLELALDLRPDTVTLVSEVPAAVGVDDGLDLVQAKDTLLRHVRQLGEAGLRVAAVVEPALEQVRAAHRAGLHAVELHAGAYAVARGFAERSAALGKIRDAARTAAKLGLGVSVGHDLDLRSLEPVARIPDVLEVTVGHGICAAAMVVGLDRAVRDVLDRLAEARRSAPRAGRPG